MVKAVIFDMDGLMFDSETLGMRMMEKAMEELPYEFSEQLVLSVIGTNQVNVRNSFMSHYGEDFPYDHFITKERQLIKEFYENTSVPKKAGLIELLQFLQKSNILLAVATSSSRDRAEYVLKKAGVFDFFQAIVCGDEVTHSKPNPEIYNKALHKLHVKADEALVLEDSENGLRAAHAAHIRTVFIKDLVTPKDEVLTKVSHSAASLHDVIDIVKESVKSA